MSKRSPSAPPDSPSSKRVNLDPAFVAIDAAVRSSVGHLPHNLLNDPIVAPLALSRALYEIMTNAAPEAHMRVLQLADCDKIIKENTQVQEAVRGAVIDQQYQKVIDLSILQQEDSVHRDSPQGDHNLSTQDTTASFHAFRTQYRSQFPAALLAAVDHYYSVRRRNVYNRSISIVQSSGTGKSRGIEEMARSRFTFLFNLRRKIEGYTYPHSDKEVRDYFVKVFDGKSDEMVQRRYKIFLCSLFDHAREFLLDSRPQTQALPEWWYTYLNKDASVDERAPHRIAFYEKVVARANAILESNMRGENSLIKMLQDSCKKFVDYLVEQYGEQSGVTCVLAFDEAQELTAPPKPENRTLFHNLELTLKHIADYSVFSVFLSTNSKLWVLAPPPRLHPSIRVLPNPQQTHPPIMELPFDVFAKDLYDELVRDEKSALGSTCSIDVMSRFGRTMWYSLLSEGYSSIIHLAMSKLTPGGNINADTNAQLACLGIRINLEFDASRETGRQTEFELVESYMRVVYAVPEHREFMRSGTPSEPILAEAAAQLLNGTNLEKLAPTVLCDAYQKGFLARGEHGELVGRLLWTLAHDAVLRGNSTGVVQFHRPIRIIDFLQKLFHADHWETIRDCRPANNPDGETLAKAFDDAYIHFSHFMDAMDYDIIQLKQIYKLLLRGAALSCKRNQRFIDFLTPVLFGSPDSTDIRISNTSVLQVQVKNRNQRSPVVLDPTVVNPANDHPVLSLVLELGSSKREVQCLSKSNSTMRKGHYQITAFGCSSTMYGVIPANEGLDQSYAMLLGSNMLMEDFSRTTIPECKALLDQLNPCFELVEHDDKNCAWFGRDMDLVKLYVLQFDVNFTQVEPLQERSAVGFVADAPFRQFNLAWKLSLVYKGLSPSTLLDTYTSERLPVVAEMLNITTGYLNHLSGTPSIESAMTREKRMDMLGVNYRTSPIVLDEFTQASPVSTYGVLDEGVLVAGDRAPDAPGLVVVASGSNATRLFDVFGPTHHTVLVFAADAASVMDILEASKRFPEDVIRAVIVLPQGSEAVATIAERVVVIDSNGHAYRAYLATEGEKKVVVVRPDGVVGAMAHGAEGLGTYFSKIFA